MPFDLNRIGQIAMSVTDADRAESFYGDILGLRKLFRFGTMVFFDCGVRLMLEQPPDTSNVKHASALYFRCTDIALTVRELQRRGVQFTSPPHLIAAMEDNDLWMAFFTDPDGHVLALAQEAPKGYQPAESSGDGPNSPIPLALSRIEQIAMPVRNADRAQSFYGRKLGLGTGVRFDTMVFFDCAGIALMLEQVNDDEELKDSSILYFRCADLALTVRELERRGVEFTHPPRLIAPMNDHDLWMAFFTDSDGHTLALMQEAPKGYRPKSE